MFRLFSALAFVSLVPAAPADEAQPFTSADWPCWRGLNHDGIAHADQKPPTQWSETENVLWKAAVPGRGHGSPIVVGNRVFLTAADDSQWLLCFDRTTGAELWRHEVHRGNVVPKGNPNAKASFASCTPACDGERVIVNFLNANAVFATAVNLDGKRQWQTKVADYALHQGFGASPAIYKHLTIVSADNKGSGVIAGLERTTGKIVWTRPVLDRRLAGALAEGLSGAGAVRRRVEWLDRGDGSGHDERPCGSCCDPPSRRPQR